RAARQVLRVAAVAAVASACSSSTKSRQVPPSDGGTDSPIRDSGVGGQGGKGSGGASGAGGTNAGGANTGGANVGGASAGGRDASTADVSVPTEAGDVDGSLFCQTPVVVDGSVTPEGGPFNGQWRDFATHQCVACPAVPVRCQHFTAPGSGYDPATRRLTLVLNPSVAELIRVQGSLDYAALLPDSGYQYNQVSVDFQISGNVLTADLAGIVPFDVYSIANINLQAEDACGWVSSIDFGDVNDAADAEKPAINLHCEF
ncbi:MAG TPA: hypothetical protein VHE30_01340, partial [Polyangiaceae bacterium]|nr:hypothetical protein [Polyangiaceae bacterium]